MNKYINYEPEFKISLRILKRLKTYTIVEKYTFITIKQCEGYVKNSLKG